MGPVTLPPAPNDWFEHPLSTADRPQYLLDLRTHPQPPAVHTWLHRTARTRGRPEYGLGSYLTGDSPSTWFDAVIHTDDVTPTHPLS